MTARETPTAETLGDGRPDDEPVASRRRLVIAILVMLVAVAAVAFVGRAQQTERVDETAAPEQGEPAVVAVRADVVGDSGTDTLVTLRFGDLPRGRTILDISGLPDQVSYVGPRVVTIPDDRDIDLSFRWRGIDCAGEPPGYVALELRLGTPGADVASTTALVDAAGAFDYAWAEACSEIRP